MTQEELKHMDDQSEDCASLLADARCDIQAYACLIGIMAQRPGYHEESEAKLEAAAEEAGGSAPMATSAGALVRAVKELDAAAISVIT